MCLRVSGFAVVGFALERLLARHRPSILPCADELCVAQRLSGRLQPGVPFAMNHRPHTDAARMTHTPTPERVLQTGLGFWASKTLLSVVELGVSTELARRPQSLAELSHRLALHPRSAADFLDALVALGFLLKEGNETGLNYANTPDAELYLDRNKGSYVGGLLEMANSRLHPLWGNLTEGLRTGEPQNEIRDGGLDPFSRSD